MRDMFRQWYKKYFSDPQIIVLIVILLLGLLFVVFLGEYLAPVIAAVVIAYLLESFVVFFERMKVPRLMAVIFVFIFFMTCFLLIILILLPNLTREVMQLIQQLPAMIRSVQSEVTKLLQKYPDIISEGQIAQLSDYLVQLASEYGRKLLSYSLSSFRSFVGIIVYMILVPILVFFFLKDKNKIIGWFTSYLPHNSGLAAQVWKDVNVQISRYVRGKMIEVVLLWFGTYVVFSAMHLDFAMLLSVFVGLSCIIPYIGAAVLYVPIIIIALFQWGITSQFLYIIIAYSIIQLIDGNLLAPLLLAGVVHIHPIAIIVAILVFGGIWGVWGLFFAIPLATLIHVIIKVWINQIIEDDAHKSTVGQ
ncbi:AI-2E family transporter [Flexistipes sp.]|uniref:AI-2E family transporter n=1 Tax=Flexistipes sinusarabici TaxID=2352 RepID=A0A3D5QC04_FLESI|nr:AI-2E family transporter [Flexistipes sp.]HCW93248.1 AI-2E family transporter [Flexistipes sinusarabici]